MFYKALLITQAQLYWINMLKNVFFNAVARLISTFIVVKIVINVQITYIFLDTIFNTGSYSKFSVGGNYFWKKKLQLFYCKCLKSRYFYILAPFVIYIYTNYIFLGTTHNTYS